MKLKKVIAVIVVLAVTVGAVTGGIYGYKSYQKKNLVAEVQSVSSLNYGYYGNSETSYGVVTNDSSQEVYLDDSNKVQEVYVSKGDTVKEGDPLIQYDTSEAEIDIQRKNLEISTTENSLAKAQHSLESLKNTKPVDKTRPSTASTAHKHGCRHYRRSQGQKVWTDHSGFPLHPRGAGCPRIPTRIEYQEMDSSQRRFR